MIHILPLVLLTGICLPRLEIDKSRVGALPGVSFCLRIPNSKLQVFFISRFLKNNYNPFRLTNVLYSTKGNVMVRSEKGNRAKTGHAMILSDGMLAKRVIGPIHCLRSRKNGSKA